MRVLISGASGMVGTALVEALRARGDEVGRLVRSGEVGELDVAWNPSKGEIDTAALAAGAFDAVIHLAGASIAERWTSERRTLIYDSRIESTTLLAGALAELEQRPPVAFVCASGAGWYGDRGDELLTEASPAGGGFLAGVVRDWEAAADAARDAGIRTVHVRMGAVQDRSAGALAKQLTPYRLGLGGPVGSGRQWIPWISLDEVVRVYEFLLDTPGIDGPVNAVGPTPATSREYAKALGRALRRPAILPLPAFAVKAMFGDLGRELLLYSQKVAPTKLEGAGYEFLDRRIDNALERALHRGR